MSQEKLLSAFPQAGLDFLQELSENNNREWFNANKKRYEDDLRTPAVELVITLGERLQEHFPGVSYDTAVNGSGSLMRIYRDTRFSKDKTPYKDRIAMGFPEGGGKKMKASSFGIQISATEAGLMAGIFSFDKEQLTQYRDAVVNKKTGHELVEALKQVKSAGDYEISGVHYKRPPRGYDLPGDERDEYLLFNGLWASYPTIPRDVVMSDSFVDVVIEHFVNMSPIQQWLVKVFS